MAIIPRINLPPKPKAKSPPIIENLNNLISEIRRPREVLINMNYGNSPDLSGQYADFDEQDPEC